MFYKWTVKSFERLEKLVMAELSEYVNVINVFRDGKSTLYSVISIHHKVGFLLKVIKVFHSVNLTLFAKRTKNSQKLGNKMEDDRRFKAKQIMQCS